jgi:hypothetical protein
MEHVASKESILKEDLIYWIDKEFLQERAMTLFGRELTANEIQETTKYIEWGLSASVFEVIDIALKETRMDNLE